MPLPAVPSRCLLESSVQESVTPLVDIQLVMSVVDDLEIGEISFTRRGLKLKISFRTRAESTHVTYRFSGD